MAAAAKGITLLPVIPVSDGLAMKHAVTLESTIGALRNIDARDKVTKIMQYGARFLYWYYGTTDPVLSTKAYKLYRTTSLSRKAFRMFKLLDEYIKLRKIIRAGKYRQGVGAAYREALLAARCLAMGCFWTFDNLSYLSTTETINFGVARATRLFSRAWSVGSVLLILLGVEALKKSGKKRRDLGLAYVALAARASHTNGNETRSTAVQGMDAREEAEQEAIRLKAALAQANAEHFKSWLMFFKGLLDLTCAVNIAGVDLPRRLTGRKLNDGVIGAAGIGSALSVIYNAWPARPSKP